MFLILRVIPGDPVRVIAGVEGSSDPQVLGRIRRSLGLDQPLHRQYADWLFSTLKLDLGMSYVQDRKVSALIGERIGITLSLALLGMVFALLFSLPMGMYAAIRRNRVADRLLMGTAHLLLAIPEFWLGILLLLFFGAYIPLFPLFGSGGLLHFVLPGMSLGLGRAAFLARLVRTAVIRELDREYVVFFTQLGVPGNRILLRHVLPNALIPIAIHAAIQFGYLLGGAIIIEQVFGMGGMGRLLLQAIQTRDFPVIQGSVVLFAVIFSSVNFLADIMVVLANPRSRI